MIVAAEGTLPLDGHGHPIGVDREAGTAGVVFGYVAALVGPFKSDGRGQFTVDGLKEAIRIWPRRGLPVHVQHPDFLGLDDKTEKFVGRLRSPRLAKAVHVDSYGGTWKRTWRDAIRADLHFDRAARKSPGGDLVDYIASRIESDPESLSSSFVLRFHERYETDNRGRQKRDKNGTPLPPAWWPWALLASDIVDTGDAVSGLLGVGGDVHRACMQMQLAARKERIARLTYSPAHDPFRRAALIRLQRMKRRRPRLNARLFGYAAVFDKPGHRGDGPLPAIARGAFRKVLESGRNVKFVLDHKMDKALAETADGTLQLVEDAVGLRFTAHPADTRLAREAVAGVRSGRWNGVSFLAAFGPTQANRVSRMNNLTEISLVNPPAYEGTSVRVLNTS